VSPFRVVARHPATTFALLGLAAWGALAALGIEYDADGLRGSLYWVAELFRAPFWAVGEVLFMLGGGKAIPGQIPLTIVLGLGLCLLIDAGIRMMRTKSSETKETPGA